ncbi:hypothetical protein MMYC01_209643 [Madurella mycetomatis]|uniref:Uncharacterized protein n=1 Tax=Madurella mycetomatis TaxID=100816 RepID=A0A175VRR1_9PEZI|nr:hypothetical protein MMYC01_209643 [Madurella mycetomatis]
MIMKEDQLPYHTSGNGSVVTGDGSSTVTISQVTATVAHLAPHTASQVSIPVESPPSGTAQLLRIRVETSGSNGGAITALQVAYDNTIVFTTLVPDGDTTFEICPEDGGPPNPPPNGIVVTLTVGLPNIDSSVNIDLVTLGFGESTLEDVG